jgi:hypothetical protein
LKKFFKQAKELQEIESKAYLQIKKALEPLPASFAYGLLLAIAKDLEKSVEEIENKGVR